MGAVNKILSKLDSYLYTIKRDTVKGWYVLEVGVPSSWTYKSTSKINCEETGSTEKMCMIQINPNEDSDITIDELLVFAVQIVDNNKRIEKMREDFESKMLEIKEKLAEEYEKFEVEIEGVEDNLFDEKTKKTLKVDNKEKAKTENKEKVKVENEAE